MTQGDRTGAMADRLRREVRDAGLGDAAGDRIAGAFLEAVAARSDIYDPHHPDRLHPARNALILLEDIDVRDVVELCAAIHFDARRPVPTQVADAATRELRDAVPRGADSDRLLEDLVSADEAPRRIALADHLDHARHLHLRPPGTWTVFHEETRTVWLPVAERAHPTFGRRFRWWTDMFERRWLRRVRP